MEKRGLWSRSLGVGVLSAVVYGIVHDQITIRISPAYLMDWHPELIDSRDPTLVALAWGVVATWWFGLILGSVLALAATLGKYPQASWRSILRSIAFVFCTAAAGTSFASAITGGLGLRLPNFFGEVYGSLSPEGQQAFTQAAAMHEASYDAAGAATLLAAGVIWLRRRASTSSDTGS